jgi:iron complex transport system substrate-binding protein
MRRAAAAALLAVASYAVMLQGAAAAVAAVDDAGTRIELPQPARRIVSLAPHLTEQLYAVGAGERIVGTTDFADYPPAARAIERVARAHSVDLERIAALKPDLTRPRWRRCTASALRCSSTSRARWPTSPHRCGALPCSPAPTVPRPQRPSAHGSMRCARSTRRAARCGCSTRCGRRR